MNGTMITPGQIDDAIKGHEQAIEQLKELKPRVIKLSGELSEVTNRVTVLLATPAMDSPKSEENKHSLLEACLMQHQEKNEAMTVSQMVDALLASGWKTKSERRMFHKTVGAVHKNREMFKRMKRSGEREAHYTLTPKGTEAVAALMTASTN